MDVREKLVELLAPTSLNFEKAVYLVDYLVKSGVTVQEWISVKDRLPDRNDVIIAFYPTMRGTRGEMQIHKAWAMSETCTHWMPLPPAPEDAK